MNDLPFGLKNLSGAAVATLLPFIPVAIWKPEQAKIIETELKRFAGDLNLSDQQKTQLRSVLEKASERLDAVREKNPDITRADVIAKLGEVRGSLREHVVKFLTPEPLTKWDAEVAKGKTFLGATVKA